MTCDAIIIIQNIKKLIPNSYPPTRIANLISHAVESSLFVGDQCLWILLVTLAHKLHPHERIYTRISLIFIKIIPNLLPTKLHPHEPGKFWLFKPMNIDPHV